MKKTKNLKCVIVSLLIVAMILPLFNVHALAEENDTLYPYMMFASSSDDGAIAIHANNFCANGSVATNGTVDFEPNRTKYEMLSMESPEANVIDYDQIYSSMLDRRHDKHQYRTVFVDYDDTPRRGRDGVLCKNVNIDKFENYLRETVKKSVAEKNSYVFINAWNEWGEGNYLEPDLKYGKGYLQALREEIDVYPTNDIDR